MTLFFKDLRLSAYEIASFDRFAVSSFVSNLSGLLSRCPVILLIYISSFEIELISLSFSLIFKREKIFSSSISLCNNAKRSSWLSRWSISIYISSFSCSKVSIIFDIVLFLPSSSWITLNYPSVLLVKSDISTICCLITVD